MMSIFEVGVLIKIIKSDEGATETHGQILQTVNWDLSVHEEDTLGEKLSSAFELFVFLGKFNHFWGILEFFRDANLLS
jgi:hypothetical protein